LRTIADPMMPVPTGLPDPLDPVCHTHRRHLASKTR
jgi:hypothetical protein